MNRCGQSSDGSDETVGMFVTMEEGYLQHCAAAIIALMIHREVAVITVSTRMWYNLAQNKHYNK